MIITEKMNLCNKEGITEITRYGSCTINGDVTVEAPGFINAGCKIECDSIGAFSFINSSVTIRDTARIGRFVMIESDCKIGSTEHPVNFASGHIAFRTNGFFGGNSFYKIASSKDFQNKYSEEENRYLKNSGHYEKINIGNDVWIGCNSIIMRGVTIGDGAVVEAGSVVKEDVPPYTIVGGNPAKVIKKRFSNEIIEKLLEIRWWDFGPDILDGIDFTNPTMSDMYKIDNKIIGKFPVMKCPVYRFNNIGNIVSRKDVDGTELYYNDESGKIKRGGISDGNNGFINKGSGVLTIHGWFLPAYNFDNVKIFVDNEYVGDAQTHLKRADVCKNEIGCATPFCGWKFEVKLPERLKNCTAGYIVVENNGETVLERDFAIVVE